MSEQIKDAVVAARHPRLMRWLISGERGLSSEAMVMRLAFGENTKNRYPYDPADFRRCMKLLDEVPTLRPLLPHMAEAGPVWAALIERWDEIESTLRREMAEGTGNAPETYALIQECRQTDG